ncbi:cell envelope biogenesis protein OmpA [Herbaspirillum robiniae]|uniref:Cell envelope biogenesis protein OmpA n=1 Tax=Herbaspirillum robiniae TaxID=2014887 RepID=A0A246WXT5_9BURK|nr:cell envelope biogenesis protein OmpA [Herbaspirillum robiniae]NUU00789.1 cell envelope biogenesis protein OmpA [Herbaspirillum robiniae]OWY31166.1 cell envelope biogenesis protein OmpA [Herbaspirillum robiniae]
MEGGKEQNFWPGFVDALSNVVLVMIFVVVVFVVTLFYYSQKLAQMKVSKLVSQSQTQAVQGEVKSKQNDLIKTPDGADVNVSDSKAERERSEEVEQLKREVVALKAKLAAAPLQSDTGSMRSAAPPSSPNAIQVKTEPSKNDVAPGLAIDANEKAIVLNFDNDSTQLTDDGTKALDKGIGDWVRRAKAGQGRIVVTGVISTGGYSDSRRRAYYRTVAVRNHLIEAGVDKERVLSRMATAENSTENASRVIVQYLAGGK